MKLIFNFFSVVGIGLALPKFKRAMPGWGKDSYGLHADDGGFFNQRPFGITFCEPWSCGDTCKNSFIITIICLIHWFR